MNKIVHQNYPSITGKKKSYNHTVHILFLKLLLVMIHTSVITSRFPGNCSAINISQDVHLSTLTVGVAESCQENASLQANTSPQEKTLSKTKGSDPRDVLQPTNVVITSINQRYFTFISTLVTRFPALAQVFFYINMLNQQGDE